ncbi:transporter substrate-binding domain-containing protein [Aquincola sp. S2]|uniref:Transporter substrate-binding domain-containing protein n=1 Tax=Pseudaquabacterium terrae TaxID=2732868 RepID=A0ABX2ER85_9BURK|nr:transporter substrate-binding domain-containing protein [Aquabacterium terrae]NRF71151.1 transporter substrate-binding domain-containing protein [Aquabacterium terrae]
MKLLARLLIVLLFAAQGAAAAEVVRFPRPEFEGDRRFDYARELLKLALSKVGPDYRVEHAESPMNQERQILELEAGRTIDVAPMPSSAEREARLLAVYIPINRGVLGLRLGLVRKGDAAQFAGVNSLDDVKRLRLAQGQYWPDTEILRANGIPVIIGPSYEGLFKMLVGNRFDYFPRSVLEIWNEQASNADALEVEPRIALYYPYYTAYFMLNKGNTRLSEIIRQGLEKAIADGSADRLFDQHFGERLRRAQLDKRVIIELKNPLVTPGTPVNRPELWYDYRRK